MIRLIFHELSASQSNEAITAWPWGPQSRTAHWQVLSHAFRQAYFHYPAVYTHN